MTTNEISLFLVMLVACILWAIVCYTVGFKAGESEGYARGRAAGRHMSAKVDGK